MTFPTAILDPPNPFAPLQEWKAYRAELRALVKARPDDKYVAEKLADAETFMDGRF